MESSAPTIRTTKNFAMESTVSPPSSSRTATGCSLFGAPRDENNMTMIAPGHCRITHGTHDSFFENIAGKTVASVRRSLASVFSIPDDAQAWGGGSSVAPEYRLRAGDSVVFLRRGWGRKGALEPLLPSPERWDEDKTPLRRLLVLESATYQVDQLFDLPPTPADSVENYVVSPGGRFAYRNRILSGGQPLRLYGMDKAMVVWDGDVVFPMLLDMTIDARNGMRFPVTATRDERAKRGAVWMSMTPAEMLSQRSGVEAAEGTVVLGGLGLGWLLRKVCEKPSVERVIVVKKSQELLDWYGTDLCKRYEKVSDVICDDVYNQIGKHGAKVKYLLDIWLRFGQARRDSRFKTLKRKQKKRLWGWGF